MADTRQYQRQTHTAPPHHAYILSRPHTRYHCRNRLAHSYMVHSLDQHSSLCLPAAGCSYLRLLDTHPRRHPNQTGLPRSPYTPCPPHTRCSHNPLAHPDMAHTADSNHSLPAGPNIPHRRPSDTHPRRRPNQTAPPRSPYTPCRPHTRCSHNPLAHPDMAHIANSNHSLPAGPDILRLRANTHPRLGPNQTALPRWPYRLAHSDTHHSHNRLRY